MSCGKPHETPCTDVLVEVYAYLDGELGEPDAARIRQHLDECGPCQREYALEETVKTLMHKHTGERRMQQVRVGAAYDERSLGVALVADQLQLVAIQPDRTVTFLDPHNQAHGLLYVPSLEAYGWKSQIEELEEMINSPKVTEDALQDFFERNPQFLCGDTYEAAHPHIVLQRPDSGSLIPDFCT